MVTNVSTRRVIPLLVTNTRMEQILHQLIWFISNYSQGFINVGWCRISSNSIPIPFPAFLRRWFSFSGYVGPLFFWQNPGSSQCFLPWFWLLQPWLPIKILDGHGSAWMFLPWWFVMYIFCWKLGCWGYICPDCHMEHSEREPSCGKCGTEYLIHSHLTAKCFAGHETCGFK